MSKRYDLQFPPRIMRKTSWLSEHKYLEFYGISHLADFTYREDVARVRKYATQMPLNEAVEKAVTECIREGILAEFLRKNRAEVIKVSIFEYDKEKEEKKLRKAEYEAGWKDGQREGLNKGMNKGLSQGIIIMGKRFGLSEEAIINELQETLSCDEKTAIKYIRMENDEIFISRNQCKIHTF